MVFIVAQGAKDVILCLLELGLPIHSPLNSKKKSPLSMAKQASLKKFITSEKQRIEQEKLKKQQVPEPEKAHNVQSTGPAKKKEEKKKEKQ